MCGCALLTFVDASLIWQVPTTSGLISRGQSTLRIPIQMSTYMVEDDKAVTCNVTVQFSFGMNRTHVQEIALEVKSVAVDLRWHNLPEDEYTVLGTSYAASVQAFDVDGLQAGTLWHHAHIARRAHHTDAMLTILTPCSPCSPYSPCSPCSPCSPY